MGLLSGQFSPQIGPDQGGGLTSCHSHSQGRAGEEQGARLASSGGHWLVLPLKSYKGAWL